LKTKCRNYQPKKATTSSRNDVCKFLLEAADHEWILQKVVLMMGIFDGCRCDELCKMMNCYSYYCSKAKDQYGRGLANPSEASQTILYLSKTEGAIFLTRII
jgi:hypothetical protein